MGSPSKITRLIERIALEGCRANDAHRFDIVGRKTCTRCQKERPLTEFYKRTTQRGYSAYCKQCYREKYIIRKIRKEISDGA